MTRTLPKKVIQNQTAKSFLHYLTVTFQDDAVVTTHTAILKSLYPACSAGKWPAEENEG